LTQKAISFVYLGIKRILVPFALTERPFLGEVLRGILDYARGRTEWHFLTPYLRPGMGERNYGRYLQHPDGLISGVPSQEYEDEVRKWPSPKVLVMVSQEVRWADTVSFNFERLALPALEHLLARNIPLLGLFGSMQPKKEDHFAIRRILTRECQKRGIPVQDFGQGQRSSERGFDFERHFRDLEDWIRQLPPRSGIICGSDAHAWRILQVCEKAGKTPGHDLLIMGCGNDPVITETHALTSIHLDYFNIGFQAASLLDQQFKGRTQPHHIRIPSGDIHSRLSTRGTGPAGSLTERALRLIGNRVGTLGSVEELAQILNTSRRNLYQQFKEQLNTSPRDEIARARLDKAYHLLKESDKDLATICHECGYHDQAHFSRDFKRHTGTSPGQWRKQQKINNPHHP